MKKSLIVNADDFGMHEDVNSGIIRSFQTGVVRSTSLMINMPATDHAVDLARSNPQLEVGLHLNVTSLDCVAPQHLIDRLVDHSGRFLFDGKNIGLSMQRLRAQISDDDRIIEQIEIEFAAQLERFMMTGLALQHINIHHYLAILHPQLFDLYVSIAEAVGVPCRGISTPIVDLIQTPFAEQQYMLQRMEKSTTSFPDISRSNPLEGTSQLRSYPQYRKLMLSNLGELVHAERYRVIELVTHPANITPFVKKNDSYAWARTLETTLVTDPVFINLLADMDLEVTGYTEALATKN